MPQAVLETTLASFRANRGQIMAIAGDTTHVREKDAEDAVEYLAEFFAIIDDPEELGDEILEDCRG